jgi:hypothetical protein
MVNTLQQLCSCSIDNISLGDVWFDFPPICFVGGSCFIYVICIYLCYMYLFMLYVFIYAICIYLCYMYLFMLYVFIYVICIYLCYMYLFMLYVFIYVICI